jgi:hypothetical protein
MAAFPDAGDVVNEMSFYLIFITVMSCQSLKSF